MWLHSWDSCLHLQWDMGPSQNSMQGVYVEGCPKLQRHSPFFFFLSFFFVIFFLPEATLDPGSQEILKKSHCLSPRWKDRGYRERQGLRLPYKCSRWQMPTDKPAWMSSPVSSPGVGISNLCCPVWPVALIRRGHGDWIYPYFTHCPTESPVINNTGMDSS